jgi:predicted TIM-barrel fold metal-dependent hydrolase
MTSHRGRIAVLVATTLFAGIRWASYGEIMAGYRAWLAQLPPDAARQIAHGNARALFADNR